MKKLIYCAAALAAMIFAGSCQQENLEPEAKGNTVTYTVELPDVQTKAIGDAENVDQLIYEVWVTETADERDLKGKDANGKDKATRLYQSTATMVGGRTNITLNLVQDQEYTILFWAQKKDAGIYTTNDLTSVSYAKPLGGGEEGYKSNDETHAAFYGIDFVSDSDPKSKKVTLKRPFAQLNIATLNTPNPSTEYKVEVLESKVVVANVGTIFNVAQNYVATPEREAQIAVGGPSEVTFDYAPDPSGDNEYLFINGEESDYEHVAMNYLFATGNNVTVSYEIKAKLTGTDAQGKGTEDEAIISNTVYEVPLQENYRTNIIGNLLTSTTQYEVVIDAEFNTPDMFEEAWNGTDLTQPKASTENPNIYEIEYPSELAWLAAAVNGTLPETRAAVEAQNFAGKTFKLTKNIDLAGHYWTPIGSNGKIFKGTFDGQNYTVKNLLITGNNSNVGLFGVTHDGEIMNLVVENAEVSGRTNVGVVAGQPYTSKYTNITVKGHVEVNGMAYVGGVGGKNAYADWTNIKVEADETSYVKANSVENGTAYRTYVGGVVGFNGEGGHSFKNITSNIDVKGSTIDVGGLFGIAHYGNQFVNCSCSGNVEIYAAEEAADAQEIGGIAGVWHNQTGYQVTFTNCTFTGNVTTNVERGTVWYDNLIGKPYNNNSTGKLIIDGIEMVANGVGLKEGNFYISSAAGLKWVADVVNATTPYSATLFDGKTVKLMNDIDLKNEEWIPIGDDRSQRTEFHGVFDGQGHTVKNVKISKKTDREDENKSSYGLFGNLKGTVKNLTVENVSISGAPKFIGALVGRMNDGLIENCHVINSSVECENWTIGGLLGQLNNGKISGCSVESTTVKGYGAVAGIVGIALSSGERTIENCSVENTTIVQNGSFGGNYDNMFGAIVGALYSGTLTVNLNGCSVENTTIKDVVSTELCGFISEGDKLVVDGYEILAPGLGYNNTLKTYAVSSSEGLVAMSNTTIKGGESVILTADIDLTGVEFNGLNAFNPESKNTFNGQGHTVSNWTYTGGAADMAFIKNWVGTIKNVTIEGASLKTNGRSAVLAAKVYANIENCHVVESTIEDSYWACGVIAGLYNNGNIENCSVDRCYVKSNGGVGGIVGVINETAGERNIESCTVKNTTVCNTDIYGEEYSGALVAGLLNVANATINFNNCTLENNTKQGEYVGDLFYSAEGNNVFVDGVQQ